MNNFNAPLLRKSGIIAGVVLALALNIYFRLDKFHFSNLDNSSRERVYAGIRNKLEKEIIVTYPDLHGSAKERILSCAFNEYLREEGPDVSREIDKNAKEAKDFFKDKRGWPYLLEVDSYRWMRRIENYLTTGHFGTSYVKGKEYDDLENAPLGREIEPLKLHYYLGVYFYRIVHLINHNLSLMNVLSMFTFFITVLTVLILFILCRLLGLSYIGSFLAVITAGLSDLVLEHSTSGWFDTDGYNLLLPVLILTILGYALRKYNHWRYFYICLAGVFVGIYSALWSVWWLTFYITLASMSVYILEAILGDKKEPLAKKISRHSPFIFTFILASYGSVLFISGIEVLKKSFSDPFFLLSLRSSLFLDNFWPNIISGIGELGRPTFSEAVYTLGGPLVLFGAIIGLLGMFISKTHSRQYPERRFFAYSLFIWIVAASILTFFGRKFILFLAVPIGISFGKAWDWSALFVEMAVGRAARGFRWVRKNSKAIILFPVFLYLVFINVGHAQKIRVQGAFILMNNGWMNMLNKIEKITPRNAIICTHWEFGDYVMFFAKRSTFTCAAVQVTPLAYWIPRALMANDERESVAILRMLSCGSVKAFDDLSGFLGGDKLKTMGLLNRMFLMNRGEASRLLSEYIHDQGQIERILALMYGAGRPVYIFLDKDFFLSILNSDSQTMTFDFKKVSFWNLFTSQAEPDLAGLAQERLGYSQEKTQKQIILMRFLQKSNMRDWVTKEGWRFYLPVGQQEKQKEARDIILFDNAVVADFKKAKFYIYSNRYRIWVVPSYVIRYDNNNGIKYYVNPDGHPAWALLLVREENGQYRASILSRKFTESILFKMLLLKGGGLNYFKLAHHEHTKVQDNDLYLYEVKMN